MRSLLLLVALASGLGGCVFDPSGTPVGAGSGEIPSVRPAWADDGGGLLLADGWSVLPPSATGPGTSPPTDTASVMLCHVVCSVPKTIVVEPSAVPGHLGHGDYLGRCAP
jgi:hypothetical protein